MKRSRAPKYLAAIFLAVFLFGHQESRAGTITITPPTTTPSEWECEPVCDMSGTASSVKQALKPSFKTNLEDSAKDLEKDLSKQTDDMMKELLKRLNKTELDIIDWWKTMWSNGWKPALQKETDQLNTAAGDQSRTTQAATDAQNAVTTKMTQEKQALEAERTFRPAPNPCGDATIAGGQGKAASISRGMRSAWQKDSLSPGLNKKGSAGATGAIGAERQRYEDYKKLFCDPDSNGGRNDCTPAPTDKKYINADTQPTKMIYNQTTIDVKDPNMEKTVETINNNLMGVASADPVSKGALKSAGGQQTLLDRRSYLARYAAARSIPGLITSWRMPGSQMGKWVKGMSESAGIQLKNISDNPSYKEIMQAEAVDRFNSGRYAVGMISDESEIEMEKLTLNAFYLMQLRDYYELMERTALTLAVQVSMMADQVPLPNAAAVTPVK